jgi:hypothetical protein
MLIFSGVSALGLFEKLTLSAFNSSIFEVVNNKKE